jgi:hypothetical protein
MHKHKLKRSGPKDTPAASPMKKKKKKAKYK